MAITRMKRIKEIIEGGISTKDHGHIAITNEEAKEISAICEKEISVQDRREYHKTYYIQNPDKYNQKQKEKKNAKNSTI